MVSSRFLLAAPFVSAAALNGERHAAWLGRPAVRPIVDLDEKGSGLERQHRRSLLSGHIGGEVYERGSTAQHHIGVLGGRLSVRCIAVDLNHHGRSAARYVETEKLSIAQLVERHGA